MRIAELVIKSGRGPASLSLLLSVPLIVLLSILMVLLFLWEQSQRQRQLEMQLRESARAHFEQIVLTGLWNAQHGGVYVMLGADDTGMSLEGADEDVVRIGGKVYGKLNPAVMARQLSKVAAAEGSLIRFHISSLTPLNPGNRPDEWEEGMLRSFEKAKKEGYGLMERDGERYFRYMAGLVASEECLGCHSGQGFKAGDVIGGLSVFIPAGVNMDLKKSLERQSAIVLGVIWSATVISIMGITWIFSRRLTREVRNEMEGERLRTAVGMAGAAAHELRQPLSIIVGFSELLREKLSNGENTDEETEIIISQCYRMNEIISKMLNVTSYRTKSYGGYTEIFDLGLEPEDASSKQ